MFCQVHGGNSGGGGHVWNVGMAWGVHLLTGFWFDCSKTYYGSASVFSFIPLLIYAHLDLRLVYIWSVISDSIKQ